MSEHKSFWATLPGILTGLATVVTAVVGLIYALSEIGLVGTPGMMEPQPASVAPKQPVATTPQPAAVVLKTPKEQTTDGWAIIGFYKQGKFSDLKLMVHGDSPAIGRHYDVVDDFRLVQKQLEQTKGKAVITLGIVQRGDSVEVLDIEIEPSTRRVPIWAKLRAVLHGIERSSR